MARVDVAPVHLTVSGPAGDAPPVLLLHGGGIDRATLSWGALIGPLAAHRRVIAPDWPGYGGSAAGDFPATVEGYARWLERLMDTLAIPLADLAGISMGGGAALWLALERPWRVRDVVLVDPYGLARAVPAQRAALVASRLPIARATAALMARSEWFARHVMRGVYWDPARLGADVVSEAREAARTSEAARSFERFQHAELHWNRLETALLDKVGHLAHRTLLVHGRFDPLVPLEAVEAAAARMTDARLVVLDAGHWPPREVPEAFNPAVIGFLTDRSRAGARGVRPPPSVPPTGGDEGH